MRLLGPILLSLSASIVAATPLLAKDAARFSVGVTGGTLGIGPELSANLNRHVGLRGNATFLSIGGSYSSADIDYDGSLRLKSAGLMIDLYPTGSGFHVSGGVRINGNNADLVASPSRSVTIGAATYTPAQIGTVQSSAGVRDAAPSLTIGYRRRSQGFTVGVEAGALFQGEARLSDYESSTGAIPQADLQAERDKLQRDVGKYQVYPILQLSAGWQF